MPSKRLALALLLLLASSFVLARPEQYDEDDEDVDSEEDTRHAPLDDAADGEEEEEEAAFDQDEFEGFPVKEDPQQTAEMLEKLKKHIPPPEPKKLEDFYPEIAGGVFVVCFLLNYIMGAMANKKIAKKWEAEMMDLFESNFAYIGDNKPSTQLLFKDSPSLYKVYASGRQHCVSYSLDLQLKARQDLFAVLWGIMTPSYDTMNVEVLMNDAEMEPMVFAVMPKKAEKDAREDQKYLGLAPNVAVPSLPKSLVVMSEVPELVSEFLHVEVVKTLTAHSPQLLSILFCDQVPSIVPNSTEKHKMLKFAFKLPSNGDLESAKLLLRMTLHFVDRVAKYKMTAQAKTKAKQERDKFAEREAKAENAKKQEAAMKKKLEKKKEEKKGREKLSMEQQQKLEEKEYKQSLKKKGPKMKVMFG